MWYLISKLSKSFYNESDLLFLVHHWGRLTSDLRLVILDKFHFLRFLLIWKKPWIWGPSRLVVCKTWFYLFMQLFLPSVTLLVLHTSKKRCDAKNNKTDNFRIDFLHLPVTLIKNDWKQYRKAYQLIYYWKKSIKQSGTIMLRQIFQPSSFWRFYLKKYFWIL